MNGVAFCGVLTVFQESRLIIGTTGLGIRLATALMSRIVSPEKPSELVGWLSAI